jgi:lipoprotein signal peptidase
MRETMRRLVQDDALRLAVLVAVAAFAADWVSKSWALALDAAIPLGALVLEVERNAAFAFSSGAGAVSPWLVMGLRVIVLCALLAGAWRFTRGSRRYAAGFALLFAGGLGNAADIAFRNGAVVDFIGTGALLRVPLVFNGADIAILLGLVMLGPVIRQVARQVEAVLSLDVRALRRIGADSR